MAGSGSFTAPTSASPDPFNNERRDAGGFVSQIELNATGWESADNVYGGLFATLGSRTLSVANGLEGLIAMRQKIS